MQVLQSHERYKFSTKLSTVWYGRTKFTATVVGTGCGGLWAPGGEVRGDGRVVEWAGDMRDVYVFG
jgi:hypothetical protein